jgi:hypothetical protein
MRKSIVPKAPARKALCLVAMLAASALAYSADAAPASGGDTVQGLYDTLLGTMKNGRILGRAGGSRRSSRSSAGPSTSRR